MEFRLLLQKAMENAKKVIDETALDFSRQFGRDYDSQVQCYRCRDIDVAIVSMGAISSEAKEAVDTLRKEKLPVGSLKLRVFRPFPAEAFQELAKRVKVFVVIDRDISFGMEGAIFTEIKSALYHLEEKPLVLGFVAGLGGRDVRVRDLTRAARKGLDALKKGTRYPKEEWIATKEVVEE
jgi:2-oxoisovalerate ferredoxin oxidoreductase alpha subunit